MSSFVVEVTDKTFGSEVLERSYEVPVVVDFWAPWCGPCLVLGPVLERLADQAAGKWILAKLDTQQYPQLADDYRVRGIPAVKAFVNGEIADEFTGARPDYLIEAWLAKILPSEADELFERARTAEATGDFERAAADYETLFADDPDSPRIRAAMARVCLRRTDVDAARAHVDAVPEPFYGTTEGDLERAWFAVNAAGQDAPALRQRIEADPTVYEARFLLGCLHADAGDWDDALQQFFEILARDRTFRDDIGRIAMIRVFNIIGEGDQVDAWRRKMGAVMYV